MFVRGSRYENVADAVYAGTNGRKILYKRLRPIPLPPGFQTYKVAAADRLDLIAFHFYQDPEQYWRICDANRALLPEDLVSEPGTRLRVPQPQS